MAGTPRELSDLTVKAGVDVSEALTGLKALTREAKRATAALRELESAAQECVGSHTHEFDERYRDYRAVSERIAEGMRSMRGGVRG
ncbi:hypothetical protein [Paenibacillus apiarius]|uniref:hypothetical protein n=1 Tax=Paenibacillus apiarius TaxID=46240 RepID=UPI003B3A72B9